MIKARPSSTFWNAFLPIGSLLKSNEAPAADVVWLASRGIDGEALSVLRRVRYDVLPLVRSLEQARYLRSFSFLVHDRTSGVPCPPEDPAPYIHLRLNLKRSVPENVARALLPMKWVYLTAVQSADEPAIGCTCATRGTGFCTLLDQQSAWYLQLVEREPQLDDLELLKQVRQHLHFFSNMSQMRIA